MMNWVLKRLVVLGIILIVGGLWIAFDDRSDDVGSRSQHHDTRSPETKPTSELWARPETLADHFARHGADFGARDPQDYARQAQSHLRRAYTVGLRAKRESNGMLIVYDPRTRAFGAYNSDGTTRTFFKATSPTYFDRKPGTPVNLHRPLRL